MSLPFDCLCLLFMNTDTHQNGCKAWNFKTGKTKGNQHNISNSWPLILQLMTKMRWYCILFFFLYKNYIKDVTIKILWTIHHACTKADRLPFRLVKPWSKDWLTSMTRMKYSSLFADSFHWCSLEHRSSWRQQWVPTRVGWWRQSAFSL